MTKKKEAPGPTPISTAIAAIVADEQIKCAIVQARGDLVTAAKLIPGMSALHLQTLVYRRPLLQRFHKKTLNGDHIDSEYHALAMADLHHNVETRLGVYRVEALDAVHELAMMPLSDNPLHNQVKLSAAAKLLGDTEPGRGSRDDGDIGDIRRALNDEYQRSATRVKITRKTTVEVSQEPAPAGRILEHVNG